LVFAFLFVLFSHSHIVYAVDSSLTGNFLGTEYPIMYKNFDIATFSSESVNGFSCSLYFYDIFDIGYNMTGDTLDLTDIEVLKDGVLRFYWLVDFPESISRGESVDLEINFTKPKGTVSYKYLSAFSTSLTPLTTGVTRGEITELNFDDRYKVVINDLLCTSGPIKRLYLIFDYVPDSSVTTFSSSINDIVVTKISSNGLLNGLIGLVRNIVSGITELPTKIANSIKGFFDNIVNAVVNLGNTILDGIKSLFIPSEEDITNMKDKWDTLLSDRFGALYQVASVIADYASSFTEQSKNTITFPSISIPLAGSTFEFGGWEVKVVPEGFDIIFDTLKMITSILATFLFINGLKNRFDKIMGGADDI